MEPAEMLPPVDPDRAAAIADHATAGRALTTAGRESLARALQRLPAAQAAAEAEAEPTQ